jgi:hypothetical protein
MAARLPRTPSALVVVNSTRLDPTRVPEWFYTRFRDGDERDFADTAEGHRVRLAQQTPPPA